MPPKARLLVVEDAQDIRELLADRLDAYELCFACCQVQAYQALRREGFDLVLLDLRLPVQPRGMARSNQVGIDILDQVRRQRILRTGTQAALPVVVMTAFGDTSRLPVDLLVVHGANDYIEKPFGRGRDLESKIERALLGGAALVPRGNLSAAVVRLAFDDVRGTVHIETLRPLRGAPYSLLLPLRDHYLEDQAARLSPENYRGIPGDKLGQRLGITGTSLRQRVVKFRAFLQRAFKDRLQRVLERHDVIDNQRDWKGYRLNPVTVRIVAIEEIARASA